MKASWLALVALPLALCIAGCEDDRRDDDDDDDDDACQELADKMIADCGADPGTMQTEDCTDAQLACAACLLDCLNNDCSNLVDCAGDTCVTDCSAP